MPSKGFKSLFILATCACQSKGLDDSGESSTLGNGGAIDPLASTETIVIPDGPEDLAESPEGLLYISARGGGKLHTWSPTDEDQDEISDDIPGIQALAFAENELWLTTTDDGVTGSLSILEGRFADEIYTQADNGTLFRKPVDLVATPDGGWLIVDNNASGVFVVNASGSVSFTSCCTEDPMAAVFTSANQLVVGGDEGAFSTSWPIGTFTQIDDRSVLGLAVVKDVLWATNGTEGLFVVGGGQLGIDGPNRPGSLLVTNDEQTVFVADSAGYGIWVVDE